MTLHHIMYFSVLESFPLYSRIFYRIRVYIV